MKRFLLIALPLLCFGLPAVANDTALQGAGGTIQPMQEHASVRMVRERVDVKLRGSERPQVRCEFVFKNEGRTTAVKMGFPAVAYGDVRPLTKDDLRNFRSWVDGKRLDTQFVKAKPARDYEYKAWYVKQVSFKPGQTRKIVDVYNGNLGEVSNGVKFFEYIVATGKNWKGPIGEAIVTVDTANPPEGVVFKAASPNTYVRRGSKLIWTFRNFEPKSSDNIRIEYAPAKSVRRT